MRSMRLVPLDVPGHKRGRGNPELVKLLGEKCMSLDVNSMKPLDNLCHPVSVIREAEILAAEAFGAAHAHLMVGGTTSSVESMILYALRQGDKLILPRNVHRSVINALVLCGGEPVYVSPEIDETLGIPLGMKVSAVEEAIRRHPDAKAVLVNNPTYYGICSDVRFHHPAGPRHGHAGAGGRGPRHPLLLRKRSSGVRDGGGGGSGRGQHAQVGRQPDAELVPGGGAAG